MHSVKIKCFLLVIHAQVYLMLNDSLRCTENFILKSLGKLSQCRLQLPITELCFFNQNVQYTFLMEIKLLLSHRLKSAYFHLSSLSGSPVTGPSSTTLSKRSGSVPNQEEKTQLFEPVFNSRLCSKELKL